MIRSLIVDDEPVARDMLRRFLATEDDVTVVAECRNGREAIARLQRDPVDLVFLDIQMPGADGFEVLQTLGGAAPPAVVFVTAFDEYAVRAFEVHALDYVLKPFSESRLQDTLARVRRRLGGDDNGRLQERIAALLDDIRRRDYVKRLTIRVGSESLPLTIDQLDWVDVDSNYVRLHVGQQSYTARATLKDIESQLDPDRFVRIHRSIVVNVDRVRRILDWGRGGDARVVLEDGTTLNLSRRYRKRFDAVVNKLG